MTITNVSEIGDIGDPRIDAYVRLTDRQLRSVLDPNSALVILESLNVITLAVREGVELVSVFVERRHLERLLAELPSLSERDIEVFVASRAVMSEVVGFNVVRGYLAAARRPHPREAQEVLEGASRVAVLEGLTDVSNVGALFRSAAALGVDALLLAPTCADPFNRRAIRTSMGTVFQLPWAPAPRPWPQATFDALRADGFTSVALALDECAVRLDDPALADSGRVALFFGSEGTGLSDDVLSAVDRSAIIPMSRGVDSLNVAASSAVAFWELCARRR
ncbi:tRNA/rRNA methyltransferase (SpoU) [Olsenella uli DSM 7084]|uniref:tRNA/rRNA methyltransferase (SpoU) n=1 Tax=Olsenella uli (strain ATCC 49627 / DSM 7084 / CCUG 31166 / CIP 109912 / JCM 12494 / LMG 11480 / NCIMB 702895 / VPI D76D-27C) TaxID=633147 RepID=E1QVK1_OLSUV|nr:RNA methyltransferase [Olsenella uli]ADK68154.1 tRNA/rRNA methyltransferase (SpoU) [Olsenella uli DSM 7084]KRO13047.1 tRNA rRNA methyltransferase SpoU [Olsenella uli DSM 7084]